MANQPFSFGFGAPQNTSASTQAVGNASTNTFGQFMKARNAYANQGLPNVPSMGTKASQPGGLGTTQKNTLPSTYTAPKSQQTATYNAQNSGAGTAPTGTSAFQVNPSTIPTPQNQQQVAQANANTVPINTNTMGGTTGQLIQSSLAGSPAAQNYTQQTAGYGAGNVPIGQSAADIAQQYGQKISNLENTRAGVMSGLLTTGTAPVAGGAAAIAGQTYGNLIAGQAAAEQAALQGTQQQLTAQGQAATAANEAAGQSVQQQQLQQQGLQQGAALQAPSLTTQQVGQGTTVLNAQSQPVLSTPTQVPYNTQYLNSLTGQPVGGNAAGGGLQDQVSNLANLVTSGQMDFDTAQNQLSAYGVQGTNALRSAIQGINPNFNYNLSQSSAQTQATGQQLQTAANSANQALDSLSTAYANLPGIQTGGVPFTNGIANWIGSQFGESSLTQFKTALADARSQLVGALNASGGTPTGNEATALQYLPDNMTPQQFQQNVGTAQNPGIVRQLLQQKVSSFVGSGQQQSNQSNQSQNESSGLYSW